MSNTILYYLCCTVYLDLVGFFARYNRYGFLVFAKAWGLCFVYRYQNILTFIYCYRFAFGFNILYFITVLYVFGETLFILCVWCKLCFYTISYVYGQS